MKKTNAMRLLEQMDIDYETIEYGDGSFHTGVEVAHITGMDESMVFKTLVTKADGDYFVFVIPVGASLDVKKAAKAAGKKSLEMLPEKELLPLTGYMKGGCTFIGMKKDFPTFIQKDATDLKEMVISGGKRGIQMKVDPMALTKFERVAFADVIKE